VAAWSILYGPPTEAARSATAGTQGRLTKGRQDPGTGFPSRRDSFVTSRLIPFALVGRGAVRHAPVSRAQRGCGYLKASSRVARFLSSLLPRGRPVSRGGNLPPPVRRTLITQLPLSAVSTSKAHRHIAGHAKFQDDRHNNQKQ